MPRSGRLRAAGGQNLARAGRDDPATVCGARARRGRRPRAARSGKLDRARSRLYRSQNLQVNMRLKALAEIYIKHYFELLLNHMFL